MINIPLLIVSVNYSDFLQLTLPLNRRFIKDILVVTSQEDTLTKEVCVTHGAKYIEAEGYDEGKSFNKGKMINAGIRHLRYVQNKNWIIHADADVILDKRIESFDLSSLDVNSIYCCKRYNLRTIEDFNAIYKVNSEKNHEEFMPVDDVGLVTDKSPGEGYFQLFSKNFYSEQFEWAHQSDLHFARLFDRIIEIKNYSVVHLGVPGLNWWGRVSEVWKECS